MALDSWSLTIQDFAMINLANSIRDENGQVKRPIFDLLYLKFWIWQFKGWPQDMLILIPCFQWWTRFKSLQSVSFDIRSVESVLFPWVHRPKPLRGTNETSTTIFYPEEFGSNKLSCCRRALPEDLPSSWLEGHFLPLQQLIRPIAVSVWPPRYRESGIAPRHLHKYRRNTGCV